MEQLIKISVQELKVNDEIYDTKLRCLRKISEISQNPFNFYIEINFYDGIKYASYPPGKEVYILINI